MNIFKKLSLIGFLLSVLGQEVKASIPISISMFRHPVTNQIILNMGERHVGTGISGLPDPAMREIAILNKRLFVDLVERLKGFSVEKKIGVLLETSEEIVERLYKPFLLGTERQDLVLHDFMIYTSSFDLVKKEEWRQRGIDLIFADGRSYNFGGELSFASNLIDFFDKKLNEFFRINEGERRRVLGDLSLQKMLHDNPLTFEACLYLSEVMELIYESHIFNKSELLFNINDSWSRCSRVFTIRDVMYQCEKVFVGLCNPIFKDIDLQLNRSYMIMKKLEKKGFNVDLPAFLFFRDLVEKTNFENKSNFVENMRDFVCLLKDANILNTVMGDYSYMSNLLNALDSKQIVISLVGNAHIKSLNQAANRLGFVPVFELGNLDLGLIDKVFKMQFTPEMLFNIYSRIAEECLR